MTQPFPPNVLTGIKKAGTASPPTENNVVDDPGAGANAPAGSFAIPYASQSGLTFYAPMQGRPGTKITAKTASPRYPTSSVQIASTYLPTPNQKTTMTLSMTFSTDSHAHTVCDLIGFGPLRVRLTKIGIPCGSTTRRHAEIFGSLERLREPASLLSEHCIFSGVFSKFHAFV